MLALWRKIRATGRVAEPAPPLPPAGEVPDRVRELRGSVQVRHVDAALPDGREWGICTECGMGRVAAADVPRLLDLHREILAG